MASSFNNQRSEVTYIETKENHVPTSQNIKQRVIQLSNKMNKLSTRQDSVMSAYFGLAGFIVTVVGIIFAFVALISYSDIRKIFIKTKEVEDKIEKAEDKIKKAEKVLSESLIQAKILTDELRLKSFIIEGFINGDVRLLKLQKSIIKKLDSRESPIIKTLNGCVRAHYDFENFKLQCFMLQWGEVELQERAARSLGQQTEYASPAIMIIDGFMKKIDPKIYLYNCLAEARKNLNDYIDDKKSEST